MSTMHTMFDFTIHYIAGSDPGDQRGLFLLMLPGKYESLKKEVITDNGLHHQ
jgi:hypothetical protein